MSGQAHYPATLPRQTQLQPKEDFGASPKISIFLLCRRITFMPLSEIVSEVLSACARDRRLTIASWNIHSFNISFHLPWFHAFMQSADISYCDGSGILSAVKYLGLKLPLSYRVAGGTDLVPNLLKHSDRLSFFLLGAKPDVLESAIQRLNAQYPDIKVSGHHGYFDKSDPEENARIIQQINRMRPNILIVGMGMPIQEEWIWKYRDQLKVNAILPCGAVIDKLAGVVSHCPKWISRMGGEWLFRLCQEPKRLATRYLVGNLAFALQLILANHTAEDSILVKETKFKQQT